MKGWMRAVAAVGLALALMGTLRVLRAERQHAAVPTQADLQARNGVPVETAEVDLGQLAQRVRLFGVLEGAHQSEIIVATPNLLQRVHVQVGDEVRNGSHLASMRDVALSPLGFRHQPLKAQHEAAQADLARIESLHVEGAVTDQQVEHARAMANAARADYESAVASIRITSPIAGTVTRIDFREGEMVPNDRPLMQVADIDTVMVDLMAESVDVAVIEVGQAVEVTTLALPDRTFTGAVVERSMAAYPVINQFRVRVEVPNPDHLLLPGYPVQAEVIARSDADTLLVPADALTEFDGAPAVWAVSPEGTAELVPVEPGQRSAAQVAVSGDLEQGQAVVTMGKDHIARPGTALTVVGGR